MKGILGSIALLCCLGFGQSPAADTYRVVRTTVTHPAPNIVRTERLVQIGTHPLDRINITRVRTAERGDGGHPVLLMAPLGFTIAFYEGASSGNYANSWVGRLARKGFDVWVVDDRTSRGLGPGTCDGGTVDCSIMATWDVAARLEDSEFARSLLNAQHPHEKPIVGGFVGGGMVAIAIVNARPHAYSGVLAWQGVTYTEDPQLRAYNEPGCQALEGAIAQGIFFESSTVGLVPYIDGALNTPDEIAPPFPGLPPNLTYRQILVFLLTVNTHSIQAPTPEWVNAVGDYQTATFQYANFDLVFGFLRQLTLFISTPALRDAICGIARGEMKYLDNVDRFRGHAFFLGTDLAMAPLIPDTAALFTRAASVKMQLEPGIGEIDPLWMNDWDRIAMYDKPITRWMKKVFRDEDGDY